MAGNRLIRTVCGMPDYFRCGLMASVEDDTITRVRPADFPDKADCGACIKGLNTHHLVYHPDRLHYPLKRAGERGENKWQKVSWEEALADISNRFQEISHRYGSKAIAWMTPVFPNLTYGGYSRLISLTKGVLVDWWGCGDAAGPCADIATFGHLTGEGHLISAESRPRLVIVWGYNPSSNVYHYMRRIIRAKKSGAKVVVIDPRYTETAAHADLHLPIRPGTDGALALGMINVIMQEGLRDRGFIVDETNGPLLVKSDNGRFLREQDFMDTGVPDRFMIMDEYTGRRQVYGTRESKPSITGTYSVAGMECQPAFQLLADMVRDYTPENVATITDIPAEAIKRLAIEYATHKPASIYRGWGMQRTFYGDLACRAINTLAAITGNINLERPPSFALNSRSFLMPQGPYDSIPVMKLYDAIMKGEPFAVKAVWCAGHNFVNQMPDTGKVTKFFKNLETVVVCDHFLTASARHADYVLPAATFYECTDLCVSSFYHTYLQLQQKVIEPLHESKPDFHISADLGRAMGLGQYFDKTEEQFIMDLLASDHPSMEGASLERLREGPLMARQLDRPTKLKTSTGRIEFYVERLKQFGQELPVYIEPVESARSEKAARYPLSLLTTHARNRIHSTLVKVEALRSLDPEPLLEIHPADAEAREISDGDLVRAFNDRGQVRLKAKLSHRIKRGVVNVPQGWEPEDYVQGHHNELTHARINPAQEHILQPNAALFDVLVEVEKSR